VTRSDVIKLDWSATHVPGIDAAAGALGAQAGWRYELRGSNMAGPDDWTTSTPLFRTFNTSVTNFLHDGLTAFDTWYYRLRLVPISAPNNYGAASFINRHSSEARLNLTVGSPPLYVTNLQVDYTATTAWDNSGAGPNADPRIKVTFDPPTVASDSLGSSLSSYPIQNYRIAVRDVMNGTSSDKDEEVFVSNG
jgi:hypothetical protein